MGCCKQLQAEDTVTIHTFEDDTFNTRLRFALLTSNWLPRPLGVLLWSLLHITLLLCVPPLLLVATTPGLVFTLFFDALSMLYFAFIVSLVIAFFSCLLVAHALQWIWHVVTYQCRIVPATVRAQSEPGFARSPLQVGIHAYYAWRRGDHADAECGRDEIFPPFATAVCAKESVLAWGPYWRLKLGSWCREVANLDDAIAI